ncbi:MAG: hypothetical protein F6K32_20790 [Desertifilum sp. SIO1I2]|nr:hypothetical protein [Desertifilum sp. SIO1I2]
MSRASNSYFPQPLTPIPPSPHPPTSSSPVPLLKDLWMPVSLQWQKH